MVWLVTHIWMFVALAAVFGLILGWALRGIRVSGGARRAMVERDIALTELSQVRGELDGLYTAQRTQSANDGAPNVQMIEQLQASEAQLQALQGELSAARSEVETVRADGEKKLLAATAAAAAVAGTGTAMIAGERDEPRLDAGMSPAGAELEWRNRYLESRVRSLEADTSTEPVVEDHSERVAALQAGNQTLQEQIAELNNQLASAEAAANQSANDGLVAGAAGAVLGAGAAAISGSAEAGKEAEDTVERDKMAWQNNYLRQRLTFMEEHGGSTQNTRPAIVPAPVSVDEPAESELVASTPDPTPTSDDNAEPGEIEQELARLRWRNRYLEGRLAYIDGGQPTEDSAMAAEGDAAEQTNAAEALLAHLERSDGGDT